MTEPTRLDLIEIKLAHLERAVTELSDALIDQQRDIELLAARNRQLQGQLELLEAGSGGSGGSGEGSSAEGGASAGFEKPPHY